MKVTVEAELEIPDDCGITPDHVGTPKRSV